MKIFPPPLALGDKIALVSPASVVKEEYVEGAMDLLALKGYQPVLMPHALGPSEGSFAASAPDRIFDLFESLENPEYKAIFCTRGGYGATQLLQHFPSSLIHDNPKWLIGFSDISALHALWHLADVASIHGPMAKHLTTLPIDHKATVALFNILTKGGDFNYFMPAHPYNRHGAASGTLLGGNLAVLNDLGGSPYDLLRSPENDIILFFEDIGEAIYKVNRMLWRLAHTTYEHKIKGLIFGRFTEYRPDRNFETMEDMIHTFLQRAPFNPGIPVIFNFPAGHIDDNFPLTLGAKVKITVDNSGASVATL